MPIKVEGISLLCFPSSSFHSFPRVSPHPIHYSSWECLWLQVMETQIKPGWEKISSLSPVSVKAKGSTTSGMLDSSAQESLPAHLSFCFFSLLPLLFDGPPSSGRRVGLHGHYYSSSQKEREFLLQHLHQILKKNFLGLWYCVQRHGVFL